MTQKILYIDDEPENLFSFKAAFRRQFDILTVDSGEAALALLEQGGIAVVMSDQRMPGMTGAQVLATIRERWPHVVRILVTGYSDMSVVIDAINLGQIYYYVTKPWRNEELGLILTNALQNAQLTAQNTALTREKHRLEMEAIAAEKSAMEARWQALNNKLQPHFLFNVLNTLPPLIKADPGKAIRFSQALARLLRKLAEDTSQLTQSLTDEVDIAQNYLLLQGIRFEQKLFVQWDLPDPLPRAHLPRLALQLMLENAIKHNQITTEHPLYIRCYLQNNCLLVENNYQPRQEAEQGLGIGLDSIRQRYALLGITHFEAGTVADTYTVALPLIPANEP